MTESVNITISAPDIRTAEFRIIGTAPYVQLKFSEKSKLQMMEKHQKGQQGKKGIKKEVRNFDNDYKQAMHISTEGWHGIPASAFRNAMISACRLVGFKMTQAKLAVFVVPDGIDKTDGTPLVKIKGMPEKAIHNVRNATGVADLRVRAMWRVWSVVLKIQYDNDLFSAVDITNLLARVGIQVGIGEGRPDGKNSAGMGWGLFRLEEKSNIT